MKHWHVRRGLVGASFLVFLVWVLVGAPWGGVQPADALAVRSISRDGSSRLGRGAARRTVTVQSAEELIAAVNGGREDDVIRLRPGVYEIAGTDFAALDLKPGMDLMGSAAGAQPVVLRRAGPRVDSGVLVRVNGGHVRIRNIRFQGHPAAGPVEAGVGTSGEATTRLHVSSCHFEALAQGVVSQAAPSSRLTVVDSTFREDLDAAPQQSIVTGVPADIRGNTFLGGFDLSVTIEPNSPASGRVEMAQNLFLANAEARLIPATEPVAAGRNQLVNTAPLIPTPPLVGWYVGANPIVPVTTCVLLDGLGPGTNHLQVYQYQDPASGGHRLFGRYRLGNTLCAQTNPQEQNSVFVLDNENNPVPGWAPYCSYTNSQTNDYLLLTPFGAPFIQPFTLFYVGTTRPDQSNCFN